MIFGSSKKKTSEFSLYFKSGRIKKINPFLATFLPRMTTFKGLIVLPMC